jgi:uncharacterized membrane protein
MSRPASDVPAGPSSSRRGYLDWVRGLAVVIMIEWHTLDSWTRPADKGSDAFWYCMLVGGFAAPLFLFMAGVSVSLASGSRLRRGGAPWQAAWPMVIRGGWVWVLAILFRIQAWLLSPGSTVYGILKVDILNIMGPAIAVAAAIWGATRGVTVRIVAFGLAAAAMAFLTMPVRASAALAALWDPLEWYLRPVPGRTTFTLFPWAGFAFAGAAVGVLLDRVRGEAAERHANVALFAAGVALGLAGFGASYLPPVHEGSYFWTSSPAFFLLRVGVIVTLLPLAFVWTRRTSDRFSPMEQFGRTSLFVYWIHVELVYGIFTYPLQRALPLPVSVLAFLAFAGLMLWASIAKSRLTLPSRQPAAV